VRTPAEEVFRKRHGVCQDFAHVQIACLRSMNLAARYVSGYLRTYPPPGKPRLIGADASHAWVSAYCPGVGWLDVDATNNVVPSDGHVTLAWGRDYGDVSPLHGLVLGGEAHTLQGRRGHGAAGYGATDIGLVGARWVARLMMWRVLCRAFSPSLFPIRVNLGLRPRLVCVGPSTLESHHGG
jgi:transglutaminase-like putative cysteine protease